MAAHAPSPQRRLVGGLNAVLLGSALAGVGLLAGSWSAAQAQDQDPAQAQAQAVIKSSCPLVVPPDQSLLQPKRISPDQVKGKNAMGCLSPADAVYRADGCPLRLCGANAGVIQLPAP